MLRMRVARTGWVGGGKRTAEVSPVEQANSKLCVSFLFLTGGAMHFSSSTNEHYLFNWTTFVLGGEGY